MLDINIRIEGDRVFIEGLNKLSQEFPHAVQRGMERSAKGIHRAAFDFLNGPHRTQIRMRDTMKFFATEGEGGVVSAYGIKKKKTRARGQFNLLGARPGSYPVPSVTDHLRKMLDWLKPGQSKTGEAGTFATGPNEVMIYDSAIYANVIHEGKWTSKAYGPRRYLTDALEMFNRGLGIQMAIEDEIQKAKAKAGLK